MPTELQDPEKSGAVSKRNREVKHRGDMPAKENWPQRSQVLSPQEQDGPCEVSRNSPRDSFPDFLQTQEAADSGLTVAETMCIFLLRVDSGGGLMSPLSQTCIIEETVEEGML